MSDTAMADISPLPRLTRDILKRLPLGSRDLAARRIAAIVENVVAVNDYASWCRLLHSLHAVSGYPGEEGNVGV